jgi:YggT family protein
VAKRARAPYFTAVTLLSLVLDASSLVLLLYVLCSWIHLPPDHPLSCVTSALTEPALAPIRRVLPSGGGIDFSPMLVLFALHLVKRLL